jgi:hypothetical protein
MPARVTSTIINDNAACTRVSEGKRAREGQTRRSPIILTSHLVTARHSIRIAPPQANATQNVRVLSLGGLRHACAFQAVGRGPGR